MAQVDKPSTWYDDAWLSRVKLTIDTDAAAGATQSDYPYPITSLPAVVFGMSRKSDGSDIVITSSDATTKLPRNIVSFDRSAQTCEIYVQLPTLSSTADTVLYIYFNNPDASEQNAKVDSSITRRIRVAASTDDCYAYWTGAAWIFDITDTSLYVGYLFAGTESVGGGLRFLNTLCPLGATINQSYIVYTGDAALALNDVDIRYTGELSGTPATFSNIANYQTRRGTVVGGASDDYITTAQVDDDAIAAGVIDTEYQSPSLNTIFQEMADTNSLKDAVIFGDDHDNRSTNVNFTYRSYYSYNGSTTKAPLLILDFTPVTTSFNTFENDYIGVNGFFP